MTILDQITSLDTGAEPSWLAELRKTAVARLSSEGMPHRKLEAWRFTPVAPITSTAFARADTGSASILDRVEEELGDDGTQRIWMINGAPVGGAESPAGVHIERLADAIGREEVVRQQLGKYAPSEHFAALNSALFEDGLLIRVEPGAIVERPIQLVHVGLPGAGPTAAYPRVLFLAEEDSEATLVESYFALPGEKHLVSAVTEVSLAAGARLEHVRASEGAERGYHVATLAVRQDRQSSYSSRVVSLGGALTRLDLRVVLDGEGAETVLDGVYHAGRRELVDHHTLIEHATPRCSSNERYRGIVDGNGQAVFDGTIVVRRDAQQTSAHQENRNVLLSDSAGVHAKPHLEIDTDDVACSHGTTVGALDEQQLYYLRSRGISEEQATAMLTFAFASAVIDGIRYAPVRRRLAEAVLDRLPHGELVRGLMP